MSSRLSNWAAIAEIASAVAVVISLIYVGFEINQNTTSVRASAFQSVSDSLTDFTALIAAEPDLARIYSQGRENPDSLTSGERMRFNFLMITLVRLMENAYIQKQSGILNEDHWAGFGAV